MKNRKEKGQFGYRDAHRKAQLGKILLGACLILLQLAARGFTDNPSTKNILTVMAVLSVLPTANVASPLLASWRYRTPSMDFYQNVRVHDSDYPILYDLILTTKEQIMPMDAIAVHPLGTYAYCTAAKLDTKKAEKSLNELLRLQKLNPTAKIISDEKAFLNRLDSLKPAAEFPDDGSTDTTIAFLKSMSM
ncbi:MAG: O-linked GlcNAc transferase-like protein [Hungatella sp.]